MPKIVHQTLANRFTIFAYGFVLGAAMMASPAVGLAFAILGVAFLVWRAL